MSYQNIIPKNRTVFSVDNINILKVIKSEYIDLVYLDPPFNKDKTFHAKKGSISEGLFFEDSWNCDVQLSSLENIKVLYPSLYNFLLFVKSSYNSKAFSYLSFISERLIEIYRILKNTGSIYFHCDNSMSHLLKIAMDIIFGCDNFRNEIVWSYKHGGRGKRNFAKKHDIIFWYSKNKNNYVFNYDDILVPFESKMTEWSYTKGRYVGKTMPNGKVPEDVWYINLNSMSKEHIGYPTQKPIELLMRIIKSCSKEGDIILDPFCGSGVSVVACEKLNRKWIAIDKSSQVYNTIRLNIQNQFDEVQAKKIIDKIVLG